MSRLAKWWISESVWTHRSGKPAGVSWPGVLTRTPSGLTINGLVNNQRHVTAVFAALADPTRRRILARLSASGGSPVTELAKPFRISAPAISRHLRVLESARLIERRRQGRVHLIRPRAAALQDAQNWISQCVAGWEFSFDTLENLIQDQQRKGKKT
jgi:DNA-binding transcriptional ArsR family regulator